MPLQKVYSQVTTMTDNTKKKIYLFDFDGTVADTVDAAVRIYNEIAEEYGYTLVTKENFPTLRNMSALENVRYLGVSILKIPFIAKQVRAMLKHEVKDIEPIKGMVDSLNAIKEKGCELHIVSSNSKENILLFLENNSITAFTDIHSVSDIFGKHTAIRSLITHNGWDTSSVTYIGDEARDIEAAKKAGVRAVAVSWGYNSKEALQRATPHSILHQPSELLEL